MCAKPEKRCNTLIVKFLTLEFPSSGIKRFGISLNVSVALSSIISSIAAQLSHLSVKSPIVFLAFKSTALFSLYLLSSRVQL